MSESRNRVTVYPLDAWAREQAKPAAERNTDLYWTMPILWSDTLRIHKQRKIVAYAERGGDRGALVDNERGGYYLLTSYGTSISLPSHKVPAAAIAAGVEI